MAQPIAELLKRVADDVLRGARDPAALQANTSQAQALVHAWRQIYAQNPSLARLTPEQFQQFLSWLGAQPPAERMAFASQWRQASPTAAAARSALLSEMMASLKLMGEILSNVSKTRAEISMTFARNSRA